MRFGRAGELCLCRTELHNEFYCAQSGGLDQCRSLIRASKVRYFILYTLLDGIRFAQISKVFPHVIRYSKYFL